MSRVEIDIYLNNLKKFFEKNPKELFDLIGNSDKEFFYEKIREQAVENLEKGTDVELTQKQFLDVLFFINKKNVKEITISPELFVKTKFGNFCLN